MAKERYKLLSPLGEGGMGVVWLARDTYTQALVAFKIMNGAVEDDQDDQKARERFEGEISIAQSLHHPHVLPVIDYGQTTQGGRTLPFLVSPYMPDGSLDRLIKQIPPWLHWTLPQTVDAILQAAEGLEYLHTRTPRIVHRDVKPANFVLRLERSLQRVVHLYLCDFGISRKQKKPFDTASEPLGTFAYIAPEQINSKISWTADQYALAVMACQLLTGKFPLSAPTSESLIYAHLYTPPTPPSTLNRGRVSSTEVDAIILRALEKKPERRFSSVLEFATALQRAVLKQVQSTASAPTQKVNPAVAPAVHLERPRPMPPSPPWDAINRAALPGAEEAPTPPFAPISWDDHDDDENQILDEPLPAKPPGSSPPSTKNEITALPLLPFHKLAHKELPARPRMLCWSPNGNHLACTFYGHAPMIVPGNADTQVPLTGTFSSDAINRVPTQALCWSSAGQVLAVSSPGEIHFWDATRQTAWIPPLRLSAQTIDGLDWSVRGQLAVWVDSQIQLYILSPASSPMYQPPTSQTLTLRDMHCGGVGTLRWSPDGSLLAAGASNGSLICWSVVTHFLRWRVPASGQRIYSLAWSPDGVSIAVAFKDRRVVVYDAAHGHELSIQKDLPVMPRMLSISVQQHLVMASSERHLLFSRLNEQSPSAKLPGQLLGAWSPVREELVTLDAQKETVLVMWGE